MSDKLGKVLENSKGSKLSMVLLIVGVIIILFALFAPKKMKELAIPYILLP